MLSTVDLERLIAEKRSEIKREKILLGLTPADEDDKENIIQGAKRQVNFTGQILGHQNEQREDKEQPEKTLQDLEEKIPPDLERYIRRYLGLPVMLKAGEYSPNNPLIRSERPTGDALLGLGEYERRRNTLRKIRQQQYREYLDQQAKKKQEAKEQAEKERKEREERERLQEEREREREREQRQRSPEIRRASYTYPNEYLNNGSRGFNKVDTGVQVSGMTRPLSVAVQTDDTQIFRLPPSRGTLTEAERELSPRAAYDDEHDTHGTRDTHATHSRDAGTHTRDTCYTPKDVRRRSYGDFTDEYKPRPIRGSTHSWMPSIFDADAIQLRNQHAEKEAAARRQFYQQELKNQIKEQQRIRDERKAREMMLEQAEMRRLEEQLRALRGSQEIERDNQRALLHTAKENAIEYDSKRKSLQKDINAEKKNLLRVTNSLPTTLKRTQTSHSDTQLPSKLPFYYPRGENTNPERPPYSLNIPENSIFSPNYDVESYLRKNLNPSKESLKTKFETNYENKYDLDYKYDKEFNNDLVNSNSNVKINKLPNIEKKVVNDVDSLPIPVLRHSPKNNRVDSTSENDMSDAMKMVDDKWKVPAVQKNILKSQSSDGKNISILTQLGSIRRQLQLEQLKLDQMLGKTGE